MVEWIMDWMIEEMEGMDSSRIWFRSHKKEKKEEEEEDGRNGIEDGGKVVMSWLKERKKEWKENSKR